MEEDTNGIFIAPPSWYVVNSKSTNAEEAKKFLQAMASTEEGHNYMVKEAGMVPAFKSVTLKPDGPLTKSVSEWFAGSVAGDNDVYGWQQYKMPDGFGMDKLGPIYNQLASGDIDLAKFQELMKNAVAKINE